MTIKTKNAKKTRADYLTGLVVMLPRGKTRRLTSEEVAELSKKSRSSEKRGALQ
jgi:hypothetical protein